MSTKLNIKAYEQLIDEDIAVLEKHLPDCLERNHIEQVLKNSVGYYYPKRTTVQDCELAVSETKEKAIKFCQRIAKMEKGCAPSAGYMQELIEEAEGVFK